MPKFTTPKDPSFALARTGVILGGVLALTQIATDATAQTISVNPAMQASRIADIAQYELESTTRRVGPQSLNGDGRTTVYIEGLHDSPLLSNNGFGSLVEDNVEIAILGIDRNLSDRLNAGGAFSINRSDVATLNGGVYKADTQTAHGYVGYKAGLYNVRVGGAYGWHKTKGFVRPTSGLARGETDGNIWDIYARAGMETRAIQTDINAGLAFHVGAVKIDGFSETGPDALTYSDHTRKSRRFEADLSLRPLGWNIGSSFRLTPAADLHYRRELKDGGFDLSYASVGGGSGSTFTSDGVAPDRLSGAFGFDIDTVSELRISARYERTWADDVADADGVSLSVSRSF